MFNGSDVAEKFDISDSGNGLPFHRVRLTRDVGNVTMDLSGVEDDRPQRLRRRRHHHRQRPVRNRPIYVNLDLGSSAGSGDGQADAVIVNGTDGDDFGQIASFGNGLASAPT